MDDAVRLLEAGDWEGGIRSLNALWAHSRDPALAAEIERLSAHVLKTIPALPSANDKKALQAAWVDRCADGKLVGLEHLLAVIREGTTNDIRARFDRLRENGPPTRA